MKQSLQHDTLAYQLGVRPSVLLRDMREVPFGKVVTQLNKFMMGQTTGSLVDFTTSEKPLGNPEIDGLQFYMLNHAVSLVRQKFHPYERLGDHLPILELYHRELAFKAARMFFYLILICTRESRHEKSGYSSSAWQYMHQKYPTIKPFHSTLKGMSSEQAPHHLANNPVNITLGDYSEWLVDVFYNGSYSSSYGGKAWGKVADTLRDFVHGKTSAEMMMDTAFTLCHNNGPIFNKGMLFTGYSDEIYKMLDVQRSGQIPQMVAANETKWAPQLKTTWEACYNILGQAFNGHVDWFLVEELGALKTYKNEKDAQVKKYGYPTKFKAKVEAEKVKKEIAAVKIAEDAKNWVEIMPGLKVKKVEIKR